VLVGVLRQVVLVRGVLLLTFIAGMSISSGGGTLVGSQIKVMTYSSDGLGIRSARLAYAEQAYAQVVNSVVHYVLLRAISKL
jgi:hypothetical protein